MAVDLFCYKAKIGISVRIGSKNVHRANAALGDVMRILRNYDSGYSCHAEVLSRIRFRVKEIGIMSPDYGLSDTGNPAGHGYCALAAVFMNLRLLIPALSFSLIFKSPFPSLLSEH